MKLLKKAPIKGIPDAEKLPCHLVVKNGQIVTLDGDIPIFDLPDGTRVNVLNQAGLKTILKLAARKAIPKGKRKTPVGKRTGKATAR